MTDTTPHSSMTIVTSQLLVPRLSVPMSATRARIDLEVLYWGDIMAGVPQRSSRGPLIFLAYINDLAEVAKCNLKMFADDTCLYVPVEDPATSATSLNEYLTNVRQWDDRKNQS